MAVGCTSAAQTTCVVAPAGGVGGVGGAPLVVKLKVAPFAVSPAIVVETMRQ